MNIALSILPCFSDKSLPLGLAFINTALKNAGQKTKVFDFDLHLSISNKNLYYAIYDLTLNSPDNYNAVNFLGADIETLLGTLFNWTDYLALQESAAPDKYCTLNNLKTYIDEYVIKLLESNCTQFWFSTYISNIWFTLLTIKELRGKTEKEIILGGPGIFLEETHKFILDNRFADYLIIGEGEQTAIDFVNAGAKEKKFVEGLAFGKEEKYSYKKRTKTISSVDQIIPDFDQFPMEGMSIKHYYKRIFAGLPVSFSRGCVNHCNFCSEQIIWGKFRFRPVQHVLDHLKYYSEKYNISAFYVCDSLVNFSIRWLNEFCDKLIRIGSPYTFTFAFAQAKSTPLELLQKMSSAGFTRVSFGIESLSQSVLDKMNKGTKVTEITQIIADAVLAGLSVEVSTIINYPDETIEDLLESLKEFRNLDRILISRGIERQYLPIRTLGNTFRLEANSELYQSNRKSESPLTIYQLNGVPKIKSLEKIAIAWKYNDDSIDYDFKRYLAKAFSNKTGPWRLRPEHKKKTIDAIKNWIDPEKDTFKLSNHVKIIRDERTKTYWLIDYELQQPINEIQYNSLRLIATAQTIKEIQLRFPNNKDNILNFFLHLYLDNIIILDNWI